MKNQNVVGQCPLELSVINDGMHCVLIKSVVNYYKLVTKYLHVCDVKTPRHDASYRNITPNRSLSGL